MSELDRIKPHRWALARVLRYAPGLLMIRRVRDMLSRGLEVFENSLAHRIAPDQKIAGGPFSGMTYPVRNLGTSMILPKLLGTYEEELHPIIAVILQQPYSDVIDIGCGEGYYAIGLARGIAGTHVHAFDVDPAALSATRSLATLNGVSERVTVTEGCSALQLRQLKTGPRLLVVSDCEGAELDLLHPRQLPDSASIDLLIECHECRQDTSISDELRRRFEDSHQAQVVTSRKRDPLQYPQLVDWTSGEREMALSESRPPEMRWLSLTQRQGPALA